MKPHGAGAKEVAEAFRRGDLTVAVYGLGKMGLPLAAAIALRGAKVVGADIDANVARTVAAGRCHVKGEKDLPETVAEVHSAGRLTATADLAEAARRADVHVVIVPTLLREPAKEPDLSAIEAAHRAIGGGLHRGDLVIQESTTPPGVTAGLVRRVLEEESGLVAGRDFGLAFCPERTLSGRALHDILRGHPKVVGGLDAASTEAARGFYETLCEKGVVAVSSPTAAEAVKAFEGVYRDVNVALANELFQACEAWGLDWREVFDTANTQPYSHIHRPGAGVGGHCIPVYPWFVVAAAPEVAMPLVRLARDVNDGMAAWWVERAREVLGGLAGKRVLVVGLTYRAGVAETRYAPALRIATLLAEAGADVRGDDPLVEVPEAPRPEAGWKPEAAIVLHGKPTLPAPTVIYVANARDGPP